MQFSGPITYIKLFSSQLEPCVRKLWNLPNLWCDLQPKFGCIYKFIIYRSVKFYGIGPCCIFRKLTTNALWHDSTWNILDSSWRWSWRFVSARLYCCKMSKPSTPSCTRSSEGTSSVRESTRSCKLERRWSTSIHPSGYFRGFKLRPVAYCLNQLGRFLIPL